MALLRSERAEERRREGRAMEAIVRGVEGDYLRKCECGGEKAAVVGAEQKHA
jgi:hypothetical protein